MASFVHLARVTSLVGVRTRDIVEGTVGCDRFRVHFTVVRTKIDRFLSNFVFGLVDSNGSGCGPLIEGDKADVLPFYRDRTCNAAQGSTRLLLQIEVASSWQGSDDDLDFGTRRRSRHPRNTEQGHNAEDRNIVFAQIFG